MAILIKKKKKQPGKKSVNYYPTNKNQGKKR